MSCPRTDSVYMHVQKYLNLNINNANRINVNKSCLLLIRIYIRNLDIRTAIDQLSPWKEKQLISRRCMSTRENRQEHVPRSWWGCSIHQSDSKGSTIYWSRSRS